MTHYLHGREISGLGVFRKFARNEVDLHLGTVPPVFQDLTTSRRLVLHKEYQLRCYQWRCIRRKMRVSYSIRWRYKASCGLHMRASTALRSQFNDDAISIVLFSYERGALSIDFRVQCICPTAPTSNTMQCAAECTRRVNLNGIGASQL